MESEELPFVPESQMQGQLSLKADVVNLSNIFTAIGLARDFSKYLDYPNSDLYVLDAIRHLMDKCLVFSWKGKPVSLFYPDFNQYSVDPGIFKFHTISTKVGWFLDNKTKKRMIGFYLAYIDSQAPIRKFEVEIADKFRMAQSIIEDFGFRQEGNRRLSWYDGKKYINQKQYGMLKEEWDRLK